MPLIQALGCSLEDLEGGKQDERRDRQGTDALIFVVTIGVVTIRPGIGQTIGDQTEQAGEAIGGAVHRIGQQSQGAAQKADRQFQQTHGDVHRQSDQQNPLNGPAVVTAEVGPSGLGRNGVFSGGYPLNLWRHWDDWLS